MRYLIRSFIMTFCSVIIILLSILLSSQYSEASYLSNGVILNYIPLWGWKQKVLIVDKSTNKMFLTDTDKNGKVSIEKEFSVLLGANKDDKRINGDRATPEGLYHIIGKKKFSSHPIYGTGALMLDYPNRFDRLLKKNGSGIWIHGIGGERGANQPTKGCVALSNEEFNDLFDLLPIGTPVFIVKHIKMGDEEELIMARRKATDLIFQWRNAWEKGDIDSFKLFYSDKFPEVVRFINQKEKIWKKFPARAIIFPAIAVFIENEKEIVTELNQFYVADNIATWGKKTIFWITAQDGSNKIVSHGWIKLNEQDFYSMEIDPAPFKGFIDKWTRAWQSKDIQQYKKYYHKDFKSKFGDINEWLKRKAIIWENGGDISITIDKMRVWEDVGAGYLIRFHQLYKQDKKKFNGIKTLILRYDRDQLKIFREFWAGSK